MGIDKLAKNRTLLLLHNKVVSIRFAEGFTKVVASRAAGKKVKFLKRSPMAVCEEEGWKWYYGQGEGL